MLKPKNVRALEMRAQVILATKSPTTRIDSTIDHGTHHGWFIPGGTMAVQALTLGNTWVWPWTRERTGGGDDKGSGGIPDHYVVCLLAFHQVQTMAEIQSALAVVFEESDLPVSSVTHALGVSMLRGRITSTLACRCHQGKLHQHFRLTARGLRWVDWWYRVLARMCDGNPMCSADGIRSFEEAVATLHRLYPHLRKETYNLPPR